MAAHPSFYIRERAKPEMEFSCSEGQDPLRLQNKLCVDTLKDAQRVRGVMIFRETKIKQIKNERHDYKIMN